MIDGDRCIDVELTRTGMTLIKPVLVADRSVIAHTNHLLPGLFHTDQKCARLEHASKSLLSGASMEDTLDHPMVLQEIDTQAQFGTIISVWLDPKTKTLAYKDPGQTTYTKMSLA